MIIQTNADEDLVIETPNSKESDKFAAVLSLYREKAFHCLLLSTEAIFDTDEAAKQSMLDIIKQVRNLKENILEEAMDMI